MITLDTPVTNTREAEIVFLNGESRLFNYSSFGADNGSFGFFAADDTSLFVPLRNVQSIETRPLGPSDDA